MTRVVCPCCLGSGEVDEVDDMALTYMERRVFKSINASAGISVHEIVRDVYSDRVDGGPETARECINTTIRRLNRKIAARGRIVKASNRRGKGSVYRVEALK
jgi:hypothetical protein